MRKRQILFFFFFDEFASKFYLCGLDCVLLTNVVTLTEDIEYSSPDSWPLSPGCSRGPSPLTMGAQDTLPVAAAFTETVNAFFKGADPSKYVTTTGTLSTLSYAQ